MKREYGKGRSEMLKIRVTREELEVLQVIAREEDMTISKVIRQKLFNN